MCPPRTSCCHFCRVQLQIEHIVKEGAVPPDVIGCPKCGKRWREHMSISDGGRLRKGIEEVNSDVELTTIATLLPDVPRQRL